MDCKYAAICFYWPFTGLYQMSCTLAAVMYRYDLKFWSFGCKYLKLWNFLACIIIMLIFLLTTLLKLNFLLLASHNNLPKLISAHWLLLTLLTTLGFIFDEHITFSDQISALSKSWYYRIRELRCIYPYLDFKTASTITTYIALHSELDNCNSLYYNLPQSQIKRLGGLA